jgi:hypothetical protein
MFSQQRTQFKIINNVSGPPIEGPGVLSRHQPRVERGIPYSALLASVTARTLARDRGGPAQYTRMFFLDEFARKLCFLVR